MNKVSRRRICKKLNGDPIMNYLTLDLKDKEIHLKANEWRAQMFDKLFWPITVLCCVSLIMHGCNWSAGKGSIYMIIIAAA